jgi:prepilin-type N-terminal cleavage/methylation domain-containing protein
MRYGNVTSSTGANQPQNGFSRPVRCGTRQRGFTILEVLAAVTLVSLVAAVLIPLTVRLGGDGVRLAQHERARAWLAEHRERGFPPSGLYPEVAPGWWLQVSDMTTSVSGESPTQAPLAAGRWTLVRLGRDTPGVGTVLAEEIQWLAGSAP